MEAVRQAWTDERLDDLSAGMHREFDQVHGEIRDLRGEMNSRFEAVDARFDALNRTMIVGFGSIVASVVGSVAAVLVAQAL
jgi:hypothetical protein